MALHAQAPRGQHGGAGILGQVAGIEHVDVRRCAVGDEHDGARAGGLGQQAARGMAQRSADAGGPGSAGAQDALGVRRIQRRAEVQQPQVLHRSAGVGGKAVDGDAVVPGLGGTRQQQRCLLLDGQQGLRAAGGNVAGGGRQVEQHQHAAARRLDAGAHEQPHIGCQRQAPLHLHIDGGVEIEVITFPLPAQALVAAQTTPAAPGRGGLGCGRQAVKCCGRGHDLAHGAPVGAFALQAVVPFRVEVADALVDGLFFGIGRRSVGC